MTLSIESAAARPLAHGVRVARVAAQVYAKLVGGHKGAVTALLPLGSVAPGGPDRLLSAGADGTIAVWEPSTAGRWLLVLVRARLECARVTWAGVAHPRSAGHVWWARCEEGHQLQGGSLLDRVLSALLIPCCDRERWAVNAGEPAGGWQGGSGAARAGGQLEGARRRRHRPHLLPPPGGHPGAASHQAGYCGCAARRSNACLPGDVIHGSAASTATPPCAAARQGVVQGPGRW